MKKLKRIVLGLLLAFLILLVYDQLLLGSVPVKQLKSDVRIGYINLHENKISIEDLKKMQTYNCDLWLFLEWNGDNLDKLPGFASAYFRNYDLKDPSTYGVLVLSKDSATKVEEIGKAERPYACDYSKYLIRYAGLNIFLNHAPPPVPGCNFETSEYLSDLIPELTATESKANIIIGDFNSLPINSGIKKIKMQGYEDSYNSLNTLPAGTFGFTSWCPKILRFDYILHNGNLEPMMVERFTISSSDHSGWVADYRLK